MPLPAMAQNSVWSVLGCWLKKSQAVSWAVAPCGISRSGAGLTAWIRSGKRMASWMKKTGMLLPTMSTAGSQQEALCWGRGWRTKVALVRVEASGEAVHVSRRVSAASAAGHGGKAHKGGRRLPRSREERRGRDIAIVAVAGEVAVGAWRRLGIAHGGRGDRTHRRHARGRHAQGPGRCGG